MSTADSYNRRYFIILGALALLGIGGVYYIFFLAETWLARVLVFFGVGSFIMFVFMAATFWYAALANNADLEARREQQNTTDDTP